MMPNFDGTSLYTERHELSQVFAELSNTIHQLDSLYALGAGSSTTTATAGGVGSSRGGGTTTPAEADLVTAATLALVLADSDETVASASASGMTATDVTRDAWLKSQICESFAAHVGSLLRGDVVAHGELAPAWRTHFLGSQRRGAALAFATVKVWKEVAAPLLARYQSFTGGKGNGESGEMAASASPDELGEAFFVALLRLGRNKGNPCSGDRETSLSFSEEQAGEFALTFLRGYCHDFPLPVWASVLRLSRFSAAAQSAIYLASSNGNSGGDDEEDEISLSALTPETLLLRSLLLHVAQLSGSLRNVCSPNSASKHSKDNFQLSDQGERTVPCKESIALDDMVLNELLSTLGQVHNAGVSAEAADELCVCAAAVLSDAFWVWAMEPYHLMWAQYQFGTMGTSSGITLESPSEVEGDAE